MKIEVLSPKGYCQGVTLAIKVALEARNKYLDKPIYVLGMLVHNEETINFLKEKGIITLTNEDNDHFKLIDLVPPGSILIFTAHGHEEELDEIAQKKDLIIYDATCPMVKANIRLIKDKIKQGYKVIFIGKNNHPETKAMLSISKDVILYDESVLNNNLKTTNSKIFVANQTTLNYEEVKKIHQKILDVNPSAVVQNEVCNTTRLRQSNLRSLDKDVDLIYIVGSLTSNNTMKLFDIASTTYTNTLVKLISSKNDIDPQELQNKNHIVIASGASTPPNTVDMIYGFIKNNV